MLNTADARSIELVLSIALVNAVAEELFFRGALYATFEPWRPALASTIGYAVATAATANVALIVAAVAMGTVLSSATIRPSSGPSIMAFAARGEVIAHGIALEPGRTSAVGRIGATPAVALPGAPDQAFAAWCALARPVLDRLSAQNLRKTLSLPLARKIASSVGIADFALLEHTEGAWMPLAVGDLSLDAIARADAWLVVPGSSEGFAAGTPVDAYMLRE